jgi:hypothetical protein
VTADAHPLRDDWEEPLPQRHPAAPTQRDEIRRRHRAALDAHRSVYPDPQSGLMVFTARFLADRGYCCGSGCRHCPYATPPT